MGQPCDRSAVKGRDPLAILAHPLPSNVYDRVYISAGSNPIRIYNAKGRPVGRVDPTPTLEAIRLRVIAKCVVWIVPLDRKTGDIVKSIAFTFGDKTQVFNRSNDGLHPRSYRALWRLAGGKC